MISGTTEQNAIEVDLSIFAAEVVIPPTAFEELEVPSLALAEGSAKPRHDDRRPSEGHSRHFPASMDALNAINHSGAWSIRAQRGNYASDQVSNSLVRWMFRLPHVFSRFRRVVV